MIRSLALSSERLVHFQTDKLTAVTGRDYGIKW
jgi:hypothetical protein